MSKGYHANKATPLPSVEYLNECFDYNPDTGALFFKERPARHFEAGKWSAEKRWKYWNKRYGGKEAGCVYGAGYRRVVIDDNAYTVHRLAWKIVHGVDPVQTIDHINGIRDDNRIANLRDVCMIEQSYNKRTNNDLPRGVSPAPVANTYTVCLSNTYLGRYDTVEEAGEVAGYGYEYMTFLKNTGYSLLKNETGLPSNNTSGYVGVIARANERWEAVGQVGDKKIYLGKYSCKHEAGRAVKQWREGRNRHASQTSCNAL